MHFIMFTGLYFLQVSLMALFLGATAEQYFSVLKREIALIRNPGRKSPENVTSFSAKTKTACENHVRLLELLQYMLLCILPPKIISRPVLLHQDLHSNIIFVDSDYPTKISSIIDWQALYSSPLFMQARFPSILDCDNPYPWGAVQPALPEDFNALSEVCSRWSDSAQGTSYTDI